MHSEELESFENQFGLFAWECVCVFESVGGICCITKESRVCVWVCTEKFECLSATFLLAVLSNLRLPAELWRKECFVRLSGKLNHGLDVLRSGRVHRRFQRRWYCYCWTNCSSSSAIFRRTSFHWRCGGTDAAQTIAAAIWICLLAQLTITQLERGVQSHRRCRRRRRRRWRWTGLAILTAVQRT